jgi:hypothetical protein
VRCPARARARPRSGRPPRAHASPAHCASAAARARARSRRRCALCSRRASRSPRSRRAAHAHPATPRAPRAHDHAHRVAGPPDAPLVAASLRYSASSLAPPPRRSSYATRRHVERPPHVPAHLPEPSHRPGHRESRHRVATPPNTINGRELPRRPPPASRQASTALPRL